MRKILLSAGFDSKLGCVYLRTRTDFARLNHQEQKRLLQLAVTEIETAIHRLDVVAEVLARKQA